MQEKIDRYINREVENAKNIISANKQLPAYIHYLMVDETGKVLAYKEEVSQWLGSRHNDRYKLLGIAHSFAYKQLFKGKIIECVMLISDAWIRDEEIDPSMTAQELEQHARSRSKVSEYADKRETILCSICYKNYNTCLVVNYRREEGRVVFGEQRFDAPEVSRSGIFAELFAPLIKSKP